MRNPNSVETRKTLNVTSLKHLALQISIPEKEIIDVSNNIKKHYWSNEEIQTRRDGTSKVRKFYHPSPRLKKILKSIDRCLLKKIKLFDVVHGSRKGHSNITNAEQHVNKQCVHNTDIKDFFPSITPKKAYNLFIRLKCSPDIAHYLTRLCTADNHLPQGYNTSPNIANLVLVPLTQRIDGLRKKEGLTFSTYIDDLTIAGNKNLEKYSKTIRKIIHECGFEIKEEKSFCKKKHERQEVTGIVVNKNLNINRKVFNDMRAKLHIGQKFGPSALLGRIADRKGNKIESTEKIKKHLSGRISYIKSINQQKGELLEKRFSCINW